jgi:hypothetical protein
MIPDYIERIFDSIVKNDISAFKKELKSQKNIINFKGFLCVIV